MRHPVVQNMFDVVNEVAEDFNDEAITYKKFPPCPGYKTQRNELMRLYKEIMDSFENKE